MPDRVEAEEKPTAAPAGVDPVIHLAMERFKLCSVAESKLRQDALDDLKFRAGNQWPVNIQNDRDRDGRPCLTMDRIEQFVRQVTNEQRQQRPALQVNPVGDGSDIETAEIIQGMCRHIEVQSHADMARDHAFEMMVTCGFGYWRHLIEEDVNTGELEIYIKRIKNPFTVYVDPSAAEPDYSDARYAFIIEDIPLPDYEDNYRSSQLATLSDYSSIGDAAPEWMSTDEAGNRFVRVAEYFTVSNFGEKEQSVTWRKINAVEVLDGPTDWPGRWIPIIPVLGIDLDVNGKRYLAGMVRKLKDPQRQYNYWNSAATETIALAPRSPWLVAEGQIEGYEKVWKEANSRNHAYLTYKLTDVGGKPAPPPVRNVAEPPIAAMITMIAQADNNLKASAGIYDASLGSPGPEQSGRAILARQKQGDVANVNWTDNLSRAIWHEGRSLMVLIPKVYDRERVMRVVNPDGTAKHVGITNTSQNGLDPDDAAAVLGLNKVYDIGAGSYDVTVTTGPSYQSKRQEAVGAELAFMQAVPLAAEVAPDLVAGDMDWPGAKQFQKRLKSAVGAKYPFLFAGEQDGQMQGEQMQMQLQQLNALVQQQHQVIDQQHQALQGKLLEQETRLQTERMRNETQITVAEINTKAQDLNERLDFVGDMLQKLTDHQHELGMAAVEHQHQLQQADQAHQQAMAQGAQQQQAAAQQQSTQITADQQAAMQNQQQPQGAGNAGQ